MAAPTDNFEPDGPLTEAHQLQLADAQRRAQKIRGAARVAAFNGWMTGLFAVCSAPFALFSLSGLFVTVGLSVVAYNEFQGRKRLLQFDEQAPTFLGWNQLGFLALIVVYCLWMLAASLLGEGPISAELNAHPELGDALGSVAGLDQMFRWLMVAVYGSTIALSVVFQGLAALYYFRRQKQVAEYVRGTPAWVISLQRLAAPSA
ncbi:MAG: hypothetical protein KDA41_15195 [Planctomycetales bacterium]|nr:hypothetical protein [Planctomycetales bacterium]